MYTPLHWLTFTASCTSQIPQQSAVDSQQPEQPTQARQPGRMHMGCDTDQELRSDEAVLMWRAVWLRPLSAAVAQGAPWFWSGNPALGPAASAGLCSPHSGTGGCHLQGVKSVEDERANESRLP
jgi:hypothetical protein